MHTQYQDILVKKGVVTREQVFAAKGLDARDVSGMNAVCICTCFRSKMRDLTS